MYAYGGRRHKGLIYLEARACFSVHSRKKSTNISQKIHSFVAVQVNDVMRNATKLN